MPHFIGKPEPDMVELAISRNNYRKEETLVVGDRLYTDMLCGHNAKVETAIVLTGEATKEEAECCPYGPDYLMQSVASLHKKWLEEIT